MKLKSTESRYILPIFLAVLLLLSVLGIASLAGSPIAPSPQHVQQVLPDDRISR